MLEVGFVYGWIEYIFECLCFWAGSMCFYYDCYMFVVGFV